MADRAVYIVTSGSYSDYGIDHVFETRELAAAYVACCDDRNATIEEWPLIAADGFRVDRVRALAASYDADRGIYYHAFSSISLLDLEDPRYWWLSNNRAGVSIEIATNPNHPDEWWIERATKVAQDIYAFGEYERTTNGLSANEINALISKREWAKEATADA